nr:hypothetical protein [Tanacetum cinerariifolium]
MKTDGHKLHFLGICVVLRSLVTDIQKKDKNEAKTDKTEHGMEKREKLKSTKVKVKGETKTEVILNGPIRTHLMGQ